MHRAEPVKLRGLRASKVSGSKSTESRPGTPWTATRLWSRPTRMPSSGWTSSRNGRRGPGSLKPTGGTLSRDDHFAVSR